MAETLVALGVGAKTAGIVSTGASVASGVGSALSAAGSIQQGRAARVDAKFQAKQIEQEAKQDLAASTIQTVNARREADALRSRFIARAAAQGGGLLQPSIATELGGIEQLGDENVQNIISAGQEAFSGKKTQAQATRMRGTAAERAMRLKAVTSLAQGGAQLSKSSTATTSANQGDFVDGMWIAPWQKNAKLPWLK